jgi:hypothetical protein
VDGSDRRTSVVLVARIMSGWKSLRTYLGACLPACHRVYRPATAPLPCCASLPAADLSLLTPAGMGNPESGSGASQYTATPGCVPAQQTSTHLASHHPCALLNRPLPDPDP